MIKYDYVASGLGFSFDSFEKFMENSKLRDNTYEMIDKMASSYRHHDFSLLFNAYTEHRMGPACSQLQKESDIKNSYVDSGGLQVITTGAKLTPSLKEDVYKIQAKYGTHGFCFDEIPLIVDPSIRGKGAVKTKMGGKILIKSRLYDSGVATGKNMKKQIEIYKQIKKDARASIKSIKSDLSSFDISSEIKSVYSKNRELDDIISLLEVLKNDFFNSDTIKISNSFLSLEKLVSNYSINSLSILKSSIDDNIEFKEFTSNLSSFKVELLNKFYSDHELKIIDLIKNEEIVKKDSKAIMILQGQDIEAYQLYTNGVVDGLGKENLKNVASIAPSDTCNGIGIVESATQIFSVSQVDLPSYLKHHVHLLGVGSIRRLLPISIMYESGVFGYNDDGSLKDMLVSYDSTTHTASFVMGRGLIYKNKELRTEKIGKKYNPIVHEFYSNMYDYFKDTFKKFGMNSYSDMIEMGSIYNKKNLTEPKHFRKADMYDQYRIVKAAYSLYNIHVFISAFEDFIDKKILLRDLFKRDKKRMHVFQNLTTVRTLKDFEHWRKESYTKIPANRIKMFETEEDFKKNNLTFSSFGF
jgi:hypothetical protein